MTEIKHYIGIIKTCREIEQERDEWFVEVYENQCEDLQGNAIIRIKCRDRGSAAEIRHVLVNAEVDWEVFTSINDL